MLADAILNFLAAQITALMAALPPWTFTLGTDGSGSGSDYGIVYGAIVYVINFDKYVPIHDGYAAWIGTIGAISIGIYAYRVVLFIINVLRGSGAK